MIFQSSFELKLACYFANITHRGGTREAKANPLFWSNFVENVQDMCSTPSSKEMGKGEGHHSMRHSKTYS
jgi:hypothetical protein